MKRRTTLVAAALIVALVPSLASAQQTEYFHLDALGSVRAITDEEGKVIARYDYEPFGEEWNGTPSANSRRFTGKERDQESGFDYFGARYYGAGIGRFTSIDPVYTWNENLTDPQRWNRYAHVRNNPLRYTDPDGKKIVLAEGSSDDFKAEYARTIAYLNAGKAGGLIAELESRPEIVTVKEGTSLTDFYYRPDNRTITYNPRSATKTTEGGSQSPALGFLHEVDHALQSVKNPEQFRKDSRTPDTAYTNAEEKRVITGSEARGASKLGEDRRKDHKTYEYLVPHADTRTPK